MKKIIIVGIVMIALVLSGCEDTKRLNKYCSDENIDYNGCTFDNVKCYRACKEIINTTNNYLDYSGFGGNECWCYKDGEAIKVF